MRRSKFYAGWRWSDNQRTFWRFLWSRDERASLGAVVEVHGGEYYYDGDGLSCMRSNYRPFLRLSIPLISTLMIALPSVLLRFVGGRVYGFRYDLAVGFFSLFYGRRSFSSNEEQAWHCHVPWQDKRMVRYRYFDLDATTVVREFYDERGRIPFDPHYRFEQSDELPKCSYKLTDFDGETIYATVHVMEMTWKHGQKWCRWMSWFVPNRVRKYIDIDFTPCYGRKKHTWKGGTCGHSAEFCEKAKTVDEVMWWYCSEHELTLVERLPEVYVPPPRPPPVEDDNVKAQAGPA